LALLHLRLGNPRDPCFQLGELAMHLVEIM
jgi:hypothetical protein